MSYSFLVLSLLPKFFVRGKARSWMSRLRYKEIMVLSGSRGTSYTEPPMNSKRKRFPLLESLILAMPTPSCSVCTFVKATPHFWYNSRDTKLVQALTILSCRGFLSWVLLTSVWVEWEADGLCSNPLTSGETEAWREVRWGEFSCPF